MRVEFSRRALARLESIQRYIAADNPSAASAVIAEIRRACSLIGLQPRMGRTVPGLELRFHVTRRYRYRIIYRTTPTVAQILDILHPRQAWTPPD